MTLREPVVFKWMIYPRHTTDQLLDEAQKMMNDDKVHPFNVKDRIIFMSMYNDIDWDKMRKESVCEHKFSEHICLCQPISSRTGGPSKERELKKDGTGPSFPNSDGKWNSTAEVTMKTSAESGHPVFLLFKPTIPEVLGKEQRQ